MGMRRDNKVIRREGREREEDERINKIGEEIIDKIGEEEIREKGDRRV